LIALLLLLATTPLQASASAWLMPEGEGLSILTLRHYQTGSYYDLEGNRQSIPTYKKNELNPYLEYGLTKHLTVGMNYSYQSVSQQPDPSLGLSFTIGGTRYTVTNNHRAASGDVELFARFPLWQGDTTVVTIQPLIKTPAPNYVESLPIIGSPFWDGELSLRVGHGFEAFGEQHFAELHAAYRKRGGAPEDQFRLLARLGLRTSEDWLWMTEFTHDRRLATGIRTNGLINVIEDYDLSKLQCSGAYQFTSWATLQAGGFTHMHAENAGGGGGGLLSLWLKF
jgi:hypothetical protein